MSIRRMFLNLKWILNGKPYVVFPGYHCGCCGKWINKELRFKNYNSKENIKFKIGDIIPTEYWFSTWGLCDNCSMPEF